MLSYHDLLAQVIRLRAQFNGTGYLGVNSLAYVLQQTLVGLAADHVAGADTRIVTGGTHIVGKATMPALSVSESAAACSLLEQVPVAAPADIHILHKTMPALHMRLVDPVLEDIQARVLAAYDVDVTKKPAYLLYQFITDKTFSKHHWFMITTQEELEYVVVRTTAEKVTIVLAVTDVYDPAM